MNFQDLNRCIKIDLNKLDRILKIVIKHFKLHLDY